MDMATDKTPEQTPVTVVETAESKVGGKIRSETPYPYFGLSKVIDIVKAVQIVSGNAPAPAAALLAELKVTKTDRLWAYGIPAATYFGLVERIGRGDDAQVKLTELGRRIALPGPPDEEHATKASAVRMPELYLKLLEQFAGAPVPSKEALKRILQRDYGIVESMAGNAAEAFLDSLKTAELITSTGTVTTGNGAAAVEIKKEVKPAIDAEPTQGADPQTMRVPAGFVVYKCKIARGKIIEIALPKEITKAEVDRIHAFLLTQIDDEDDEGFGGS
jgi:hypothetical protein